VAPCWMLRPAASARRRQSPLLRGGGRGKLTCGPGTVKERPPAEPPSVCVLGHGGRAQLRGGERACSRLEGRKRRDLHVELRGGQIAEAARARQDPRLEGSYRFVVGAHGAVERAAELVEVPRGVGQRLVQLPSERGDLAGIAGELLLLPAVGDGEEQREERRRRRQDHPLGQGPLEKLVIVLERGGEERVVGQVEDDQLRAVVEPGPVRLARELLYVLPDLRGVVAQAGIAPRLVGGLCRVEI